MSYIKARYTTHGKVNRSYVFFTEDEVKAGDIVVNENGAKLEVTDEIVDKQWVHTYGTANIAKVKKHEESEDKENAK